jgi:anti-sigma regulatory factor (Ser/Thr protein kinase)
MTKVVQKTISKPSHPKFLHEVRELLGESLAEIAIPRRTKDLIILAVDEAVSSVVQYARYKGFESQITLSIDIDDVRFKAVLADSLNVFELGGGLSESQVAEKVAREKSFTLGVFLMRQIMDEITYLYKKGFQNELELIKFL